MTTANFRVWRGDKDGGDFVDYVTEVETGMVVLDAVHKIQAESANDLACRWNCKAGKCGSCSAEINGNPRLLCMTRLSDLDQDARVEIGWSWTTAPVASCDAEDGPVVIEALLDKESRLKGFYALCIGDIAGAVKVLDADLPPGGATL